MIGRSFAAACLVLATGGALRADDTAALLRQIDAGTIAAISDGDFVGATYATGRLNPGTDEDVLTVLGRDGDRVSIGHVAVSNSVTSPPEAIALARDGRTAFVVERLGARRPGIDTARALPAGRRLHAIDLADKARPRIAATAELAAYPESVRVSPDGSLVAVVSNSEEASVLQLIPYRAGKFGAVTSVPLAAHGIAGSGHGPRGGVTASFADWHPSGRYLAVNVYTQNRVVFFELQQDGAGLDVRRWGNIVETGKDPFVGRFTPDGAYYLTADWGRDFTATTLEGRLPPRRSSISVIRLGEGPDPEHRRLGGVETDESSEGLAVSPDGRLVATVNMRTTAFSPDSARFAREATVTLLTFDPARGALEKVADYPFTGVLPEGATFDLSGNTLLVTVFQEHGGKPAGGGIDVWRVVKQEQPRLERAGRIVVPHGVHHVEVAR